MKLIRIANLGLIVLLPLMISNKLILKFVLLVMQLMSVVIFFFRVTYKRVICEYLLMIGYFCGLVSNLEFLLS